MGDTYILNFYTEGAIFQYCFSNGIISALQFIISTLLIRDTLPNHHIPTFALGAIATDLLARSLLHQSLLSSPSIALFLAGVPLFISLFQKIRIPAGPVAPSNPKHVIFGLSTAFILHLVLFTSYFLSIPHSNPIPGLIDAAGQQFHLYTSTATSSTLRGAVAEYNARYGRHPPPGFDIWYQYATDRRSRVINEYDQIVGDLKPFWGIDPKELRERVVKAASVPGNDLAHIRVRDGKTEIKSAPQWRWMSEEMVRIINAFVKWLPDMDIVFNEDDECRLVIPWAEKQALYEAEEKSRNTPPAKGKYTNWYPEMNWPEAKQTEETDFTELSLCPIWDFTLQGCPPDALARTPLLSGPHLHTASLAHHTTPSSLLSTLYVNNYTSAANICNQPDLRFASGFFMSPASFKATHVPIPIFSQSRVEPFNDILAPSPWYYSGRARYEDDKDYIWKDRYDTFFWRGATTNGISTNGGWIFHLRERFIRATRILRGKVDVGLTSIQRCRPADCEAEAKTFPLKENVQFEEFFKYKYLPDIDGSAMSGRWIAFLKSRGLPFKLALFREWFDSRLVPWRHFVPVDLRLRERDFGGVVNWFMEEGNGRWAKKVADGGREWGLAALRDQDAEIYFFRLLLEYARVMNDEREHLGFVL